MASPAIRTTGLTRFLRVAAKSDRETRKVVRDALREAGRSVRDEAARNFEDVSPRSAAGYRVRVRQRGVAVEQSIRRTTGARPDFGALQMREALVPALDAKRGETVERVEDALDRIVRSFNG